MSSAVPAAVAAPDCIIIGPSGAGKTCLLAAVKVAADSLPPDGPQFTLLPRDRDTTDFFVGAASQIMTTGRFGYPGNATNQSYAFSLTQVVPGFFAWLSGKDRQRHEFRTVDTRGGWGISRQVAQEVIDVARASSGLILLVDASDASSSATLFGELLAFLAASAVNDQLTFRRVAVVLTKADRLVADEGPRARAQLAMLDPWRHAIERAIGRVPLRQLAQYLRPEARPAVHCGWASVYGFIPEDGAVNCIRDADGERLAVYNPGDPGWPNRWHPFQVLDPFVYVATGQPMGLRPIPDSLIAGL